jgi:DNA-binding response OmpR family regulator
MSFQVLVCEDDAATRQWLTDCLARWGMSVVHAATGVEVVRLACSSPPDLILLNMVLPDVDSVAVMRKLSTETKTTAVPVIGLAPSGWMADKLSGVQVAGVISKPITEKALENCLREVCPGLASLMPTAPAVLVYDESGELGPELEDCLRKAGLRMICAAGESEVTAASSQPAVKAAIVMLRQDSPDTPRVLRRLVERRLALRLVVVADRLQPQEVRALSALGVHEILVRPFSDLRLSLALQKALEPVADPAGGGKRVLLVEDAALVAKMMSALLEQAGYCVVHAANAESAWQLLQHNPPQLMLLDVILPGMDGVEFVHRIQQSDLHIPFAVVTGAHDPRRMSALRSLGALRVFEKPIHSDELLGFMDDYFAAAEPG